MPGTIQVSILELVGLPSIQQSSSMDIKVSMGKQAHEIQEKGDFSFTLVSFRDNLNVSIHDYEGNEIAHTGIQTRSIVERGIWDDLFPLNGGGHVHMILRFILTEEEQNRIRSMRELAARKKQEDLLKRSRSSSDLTVASGGRPAPSGDKLKTPQYAKQGNVSRADSQGPRVPAGSNADVLSEASPGQKKQAFSTSKSTGALDKLFVNQRVKERIQRQDQKQKRQVDKMPSSVRKMIIALESSPVKEELPGTINTRGSTRLGSTPTVEIVSNAPSFMEIVPMNVKKNLSTHSTPGIFGKGREVGDFVAAQLIIQKKDQFNEPEFQPIDEMHNEKNRSEMIIGKEESKEKIEHPPKLCRSPPSQRCKSSWKTLIQALPRRNQFATVLLTENQVSTSCSPLVVDKNWRSKHWKSFQHKAKCKVSSENEHYFLHSSRRWIFLDESIYSCVRSDDMPFIDPFEGCLSNCSHDTNQEKLTDTGIVPSEDEKISVGSRQLESDNRPNNRDPTRPFEQAMKIAIMVGFGLLVLFTRQRK